MSLSKTLVTEAGRRVKVTVTPDEFGRVVYAVDRIGAFTVEPDTYEYRREPGEERRIHVQYGRVEGPIRWIRDDVPDRPVVCSVELAGGAVIRPSAMRPDRHWGWLVVCRASGGSAPDGTSRRTADLVHCLITDWLARDDLDELRHFHDWHHARGRIAHAERTIRGLRLGVAKAMEQLTEQYAYRAEQLAILGEEPAEVPQLPNPETAEGRAIIELRAQLRQLWSRGRRLPADGAVSELVQQWLADLGLALPQYPDCIGHPGW